jgi:hypothetical protein
MTFGVKEITERIDILLTRINYCQALLEISKRLKEDNVRVFFFSEVIHEEVERVYKQMSIEMEDLKATKAVEEL